MTIQELFIMSNQALQKVVLQITDEQWKLAMPPGMSSKTGTLKDAIRMHTYDDAWVPEVLVGKTKEEVGNAFDYLLKDENVLANYNSYNNQAINAVHNFKDLDRTTHLSYGDFPARNYLQHITSFRAFRSYDIAKLIGVDTTMSDDFVKALLDEFTPVVEGYRKMGVFPAPHEVATDASLQNKLLAMVGRD